MKGKQYADRRLAVERRERKERLFTYLDIQLTINGELPSQVRAQADLGFGDRAIRMYIDDLVAEGRLVKPGRWDSIRVASKESPR